MVHDEDGRRVDPKGLFRRFNFDQAKRRSRLKATHDDAGRNM